MATEDRYLERLLKSKYCPKGIHSLNISLTEYNDLLEKFRELDPSDGKAAYSLSVQALSWQDWFTSVLSSLGCISKVLDSDKNTRIAKICQTCGERSITRAEKIAMMDPEVIELKKQKAITDAIYGLIEDKNRILDKIFYLCRGIAFEEKSDSPAAAS